MGKWLTFFKERTPFASYLLITLGPPLSGYFLSGRESLPPLLYAFVGFFLFFLVLRMMDEYKDYQKDVLAHPQRPLPRGLISLAEFNKGISVGLGLLVGFDVLLFFLGYKNSFYLYSLIIIHLWLMYKEFYCAEWLNTKPLIYAITHQLILITLCLFSLIVFREESGSSLARIDWVYSFSVFFAFFSYEICRKLNPGAHPVLKTYLAIYGLKGVMKIVSTLLFLHVVAIFFLFEGNLSQIFFYLSPFLLFGSLIALFIEKINFKTVESMATVNLLIFLYSGIFYAIAI